MSKRSHSEMESKEYCSSSSTFMAMFENFRAELDDHHDRRERIIKASRDITAASKKIIFSLQRIRSLNCPLPQHIAKSNSPYELAITNNFTSVSRDLQGLNAHRYSRQISGGCQEWIEAISFSHYLTTATLIGYADAARALHKLTPQEFAIELTPEDYLLGIFDMTGELMRFAITGMATSGALPTSGAAPDRKNVLHDLRDIRSALESFDAGPSGPFAKDVEKKMEVMQTSVEKVERSLYGLVVRGAERPKGWMPESNGPAMDIEGEART